MFANASFLALIPARAGSKGIPQKNSKQCAGKPLISWTFDAVRHSRLLDDCYCSTDDVLCAQLARQADISVIKRPKRLAQDTTRMLPVILHALKEIEKKGRHFDYVVLLQPTSPLRTGKDIDKAIRQIIRTQSQSLASVHPLNLRAGLIMQNTDNKKELTLKAIAKGQSDLPRQASSALYYVNGAIYIWKREYLTEDAVLNAPQCGIVLPATHTQDIDTVSDFVRCEKYLKRRQSSEK